MSTPTPFSRKHTAAPTAHISDSGAWSGWLQIGLTALALLLLNILSCRKFAVHDATRSHIATLSDTTGQVLAALDDDVRITVAFVNDSPLKEKAWRLACAYADARPGTVRARLLDPVRDPEGAREMAKRHNIEFKDNSIIVSKGKRVQVLPASSLEILQKGPDGLTRSLGFCGENALTTALLRLIEPTPPTVYLLTGKGPWPATTNGNGSDTLRTLLPNHNAVLKELSLENLEAIPDDAAALLLVNPRYDLSGREVRMLREYWDARKGGIAVLLNPSYATPNLDAFLKFHGITPDRRMAMKATNGSVGSSRERAVTATFLPGGPLTDPFVNSDAKFPGISACLTVESTRDDLRARGIKPFIAAESTPDYWAESRPDEPSPIFDAADDRKGPLALVAGVERAAVDDNRVRLPAARMLVFANPHLLDPDALLQVNVDFFFSGMNWLLDRQMMIGANPRQPTYYQTAMNAQQSRILHVLLLAAFPALAFCGAWLVHQRRRS